MSRNARSIAAAAAALVGLAVLCGTAARAAPPPQPERLARIGGHPNLNGIWQAVNTANWNLEGSAAEAVPEHWKLGAYFAIPAGQSVVVGGKIPYLPEALAQRDKNRASWLTADPETKCFRAGIPRSTYMPYPFEIVQGDGDIMFIYSYATSNRTVRMTEHLNPDEVLVEQWLGWSNGHWEGDTLVVEVFGQIRDTWLDRAGNFHQGMTVTERYTPMDDDHLWYEATITDPKTYSRPWTIAMPLYRKVEPNAELLEYKCVEIAEPLLYGDLLKEPIK